MITTARSPTAGARVALLLAALLAAPLAPAAETSSPAATVGWETRTLEVDGLSRSALVRAAPRRPVRAIVLLLHGFGGSPEQYVGLPVGDRPAGVAPAGRWTEIADREGLVLVAARGSEGPEGRPGWNDCRGDAPGNPLVDDVAFLERLVRDLRREHGVPADRVFAAGFSNGGHMALRLAIERPAQFRAIAAVAAAMPARSECAAPRRAVRVQFINGTADSVLPFGGGAVSPGGTSRGSTLGTVASAELWAALGAARRPPQLIELEDRMADDASRVRLYRWLGARGAAPVVELVEVLGGGHNEPSASRRTPRGPQNGDVESTELMWAFFERDSSQEE